ncbi:MAG TPA: peptidase M16, partial [Bacteroidetes bacterium]|nr:peptidase M16 [Bacteroidota bacterium]
VLNNPNLINSEIKKYFEFDKNKIISAAKKYLQKNKRVVLFYMPEKN